VLVAAARSPVAEKLGFSFSTGGSEGSAEVDRGARSLDVLRGGGEYAPERLEGGERRGGEYAPEGLEGEERRGGMYAPDRLGGEERRGGGEYTPDLDCSGGGDSFRSRSQSPHLERLLSLSSRLRYFRFGSRSRCRGGGDRDLGMIVVEYVSE